MRKPTRSEAIFLAGTLTAATLLTFEVVPEVIEFYGKRLAVAQAEIKRKKLVDPKDVFSMGFFVGSSVGVFGTIKCIAAKINFP